MDFTVGGERIALTHQQVIQAMTGVAPEPFQKHVVELGGTVYPPKQVFATVTGRDRQSFTTLEAQRVLKRLGFVCREAGQRDGGTAAWVASVTTDESESRVAIVDGQLATIQLAIAQLAQRVTDLERRDPPDGVAALVRG